MGLISNIFVNIFQFCNGIINNYWLTIILFTFISKIILLPISVIVQNNSIKMVQMYPEINRIKTKYFGNKDLISEKQYELYKEKNYKPLLDIIPALVQLVILMGVVAGFPKESINDSLLLTIGAASSSFVLCSVQNEQNVLQSEQSNTNKIGVMVFSIDLSIFLALFVSKYVVFYWICSNLMSAGQVFILNYFINPKKYIDYDDLKQSKAELNAIIEQNKKNKKNRNKELINREKRDYKRFIKYENKQIVFYSEKNGFYKYYKDIIELILKKTDIIIHYISSDSNDEIFALTSDNFQTYYIDEKIMALMMQMDADIVVMTTPDLQNYYIKRSMVRDDIEYIYVDHATNSMNLSYHKDALAHYDTVFVQNTKAFDEIRAQEKVYNFKKKKLVKVGCPLIDNMIKAYCETKDLDNKQKTILIAPSWQQDNILDLCIDELLSQLVNTKYQIVLRPHPQYIKLYPNRYKVLKDKFSSNSNLIFENDFSSNQTVYDADILITDWSAIAFEYAFSTLRPIVYINTPMKVMNYDYKDINIVPFDIEVRDKIGIEIEVNDIKSINEKIDILFSNTKHNAKSIKNIREKYLYNLGNSAKYGAKYIVDSLIKKYEENEQNNKVIEEVLKVEEKPRFKDKFSLAFIVSMFTCLTLFFFSPMEIYVGNYSDFIFPINNVWWVLLVFSIFVSIVITLLLLVFPIKVCNVLCILEMVFGLLCYIQMLFLNSNVTSLFNGDVVNRFSLKLCFIDLLIWLLIGLILLMLFNKYRIINNIKCNKLLLHLCISLVLIQLFGFVQSLSNVTDKIDRNNYLSNVGEFELAQKENTIVFILDYCDGVDVEKALEMYPNLFDSLVGFTYYPDATTTYSRTYPSIPYLLTGIKCNYDKPYMDYISDAWKKSKYLSCLSLKQTNIGLYTDVLFIPTVISDKISNFNHYNAYDYNFINKEALIKEMTVLSAYRCAPYFLKNVVYNIYPLNIERISNTPEDYANVDNEPEFYRELKNHGIKITDEYDKAFRFYHMNTKHAKMNTDIEYIEPNATSTEDTLYADFEIINSFFDEMKKNDVYDNSTIIITTDHGIPSRNIGQDGTTTGIMLIKEPGNEGKIEICESSICHDDLFELIYEDIRIKDKIAARGKNCIRHIYIPIDEKELLEYTIRGDARYYYNWKLTNTTDIIYSLY